MAKPSIFYAYACVLLRKPSQISREASDFYAPVYRLVPDAWRYLSDRAPAFENFRQEVEDRLEMGMDSIPI